MESCRHVVTNRLHAVTDRLEWNEALPGFFEIRTRFASFEMSSRKINYQHSACHSCR